MLSTEHISHTGDTGPRNIYDHFIIFRRKIKNLEDFLLIFLYLSAATLNHDLNDAVECWPDFTIDLAARPLPRGAWRWPRTRWWSSSCCRSSWCPPPTTASSPRSGGRPRTWRRWRAPAEAAPPASPAQTAGTRPAASTAWPRWRARRPASTRPSPSPCGPPTCPVRPRRSN